MMVSSTDKSVSILEAATGNYICSASCGEITTGMIMSQNFTPDQVPARRDAILIVEGRNAGNRSNGSGV